ncbi:hypothetical protein KIH27_12080 [Mycobacterium sp. M1]|uniref:Uncharacterized protein n=1 Tax=Mycolicibacter acidiphilus TaxID=2835306 RepID=A0ABS5RL55_9MYCO|nr:hypothetical protein [Mycolicibacter acidiphilus]MBS9534324.1 hypothetical protein [Mycolicibacter acidiphilus]
MLALIGGAAAAAFALFAVPAALAHADTAGGGPYETCADGTCLVMGVDNPDTWTYGGFRPYFTDWKGDQAYNVDLSGADGTSTDAGSYDVKVEDFWTPLISSSTYHYGDFTPAAGETGADLGAFADLTGTSVYTTTVGDFHQVTIDASNGATYWIVTTPDFVNTVVTMDGASQDYIQHTGDAAPSFLWNSLTDPTFVSVPNYLIPDDPYSGIDFDPSQFLDGSVASL